ncbi:ATP-binding cassette domain-containing protein, partial [Cohnella sp. GbtcB17]|uniref:ATP-binding cassette domain-containing protein n=1 Tax=Cohnella sp. GbtcB17 TaxID=2824762 RepID=UPI001C30E470
MSDQKTGSRFELRQLGIRFGEKAVLQQIDLSVREGEFIAVVGRSGCGKSTLLRLIAGIERPTEGQILFNDASGINPNAYTRVLFQESRLLPWKTVLDNVRVGARSDRNLALEALAHVGLADRAKEWPHVLSGGQKQGVALARALASCP